jgi:hypothetical protein
MIAANNVNAKADANVNANVPKAGAAQ